MPKIYTQAELPKFMNSYELLSQATAKNGKVTGSWLVRCVYCKAERTVLTFDWRRGRVNCPCQGIVKRGNRKPAIYLTYQGETLSVQAWAERAGVSVQAIYKRMKDSSARAQPYPVERIIYGLERQAPARPELLPLHERMISDIMERARKDALDFLRPTLEAAVTRIFEMHLEPYLRSLLQSGKVEAVTAVTGEVTMDDPKSQIEQGLLAGAAPNTWYNPIPHPRDQEQVYPNCTYRQLREDIGDFNAEEHVDPEFDDIYLKDQPYEFWVDQQERLARERKDEERQQRAEIEEAKRLAEQERAEEEARRRREESWRYVLPVGGPHHTPSEFIVLQKPLPDAFTPQEQTEPLTQQEVDHLLSAPWWQERMEYHLPDGSWKDKERPFHTAGFCLRSQYDRIAAWVNTTKDQARGNPHYSALAFGEEYRHCVDHRLTNHELEFQYCEDWVRRKRFEQDSRDTLLEWLPRRLSEWFDYANGMADQAMKNRVLKHIRAVLQVFGRRGESELRSAVEALLNFHV